MRFIETGSQGSRPMWGDRFCFVDSSTVRVFKSSDSSEYQEYHDYKKLDSSFDDVVFTSSSTAYDWHSPCQDYITYEVSYADKITSTAFSATVVTSAFLCVAIIVGFVWACIRGVFPRHLRSVR